MAPLLQHYSLSVYLVKQLTSVTLLQKLRAKGIRNPDHSRALSKCPGGGSGAGLGARCLWGRAGGAPGACWGAPGARWGAPGTHGAGQVGVSARGLPVPIPAQPPCPLSPLFPSINPAILANEGHGLS